MKSKIIKSRIFIDLLKKIKIETEWASTCGHGIHTVKATVVSKNSV